MSEEKIFNSIDNNHQISINIITDVAWFNINKLNFESFKTFLILLKDVLIYMKKNNVKYIKQYVNEEDMHFFKKSSIFDMDNNVYSITTKIDDFVDEIVNVFDIKKM